jgi:Tfp pilus assembly protein PilN
MLYLTRRLAPAFNILCFLCICALIGATSFMLDQTRDLEQQISKVTSRADSIRIAPPLEINQEELKQTVQFVKDLTFIRNAPSYKRIINELSNALPDNMILEILKIGYATGDLQLEMFGHLDASFENAHREYRTFESRLKRKGYSIVKSQFDTELKKSKFLLTLNKKIL